MANSTGSDFSSLDANAAQRGDSELTVRSELERLDTDTAKTRVYSIGGDGELQELQRNLDLLTCKVKSLERRDKRSAVLITTVGALLFLTQATGILGTLHHRGTRGDLASAQSELERVRADLSECLAALPEDKRAAYRVPQEIIVQMSKDTDDGESK